MKTDREDTPIISVLENLPCEGGRPVHLAESAFEAKFKCKYTNEVSFATSLQITLAQYKIPEEYELHGQKEREAVALLENSHPALVVVNMGEIGYGVAAREDIKEGTMLCIYSGKILQFDRDNAPQNLSDDDYILHYPGSDLYVSGCKEGNISRFFQHLFLSDGEEFEKIVFSSPEIKDKVVTSNLKPYVIKIKNIPYCVWSAAVDIRKDDILGYDYTAVYWKSKKIPPKILLKTGKILSQEYFHLKQADLTFDIGNMRAELSLTREQVLQNISENRPVLLTDIGNDLVPLSLYQLRETSVVAGLLSWKYSHVDNGSVGIALKEKFPGDDVKTYLRNPVGNRDPLDNYIADVVVTAKNVQQYKELFDFLSAYASSISPTPFRCTTYEKILEIVIKDVNDPVYAEQVIAPLIKKCHKK